MADEVTEEERRLIDDAVADGRVEVIKPGRSAWMTVEGVFIGPGDVRSRPHRHKEAMIARRREIRVMVDAGASDEEVIARMSQVSARTARRDLNFVRGHKTGAGRPSSSLKGGSTKKPKTVRQRRAEARREHIRRLVEEGKCRAEIITLVGSNYATVVNDLDLMGLTAPLGARGRKPGGVDNASLMKQDRADRKRKLVDRRRIKVSPVPTGKSSSATTDPGDRTRHTRQVFEVPDDPLRDGKNQVKLGGDVLVGDLKGYRLMHLTLEERATCPKACQHWLTCYGNNMQYAKRWQHGPKLERALRNQVELLMDTSPRGVLVRLHTLGDFYSADYLALWGLMLKHHPRLACFGFTAHVPGTPMGDAIARMREAWGKRFAIRHSASAMRWGSFTIDFPTERKTLGDAIICPEQRHAMNGTGKPVHCGSCALCWQTDRCIVFVEH